MARVIVTHLMREGEVALWHRGKIVWSGCPGAIVTGIEFDAVAISRRDLHRIDYYIENSDPTDLVCRAIAAWLHARSRGCAGA